MTHEAIANDSTVDLLDQAMTLRRRVVASLPIKHFLRSDIERVTTALIELLQPAPQDSTPAQQQVVAVTDEMIAAGRRQHYEDTRYSVPINDLLERIFRAMLSAAPPAAPASSAVEALRESVERVRTIQADIADFDGDRRGMYAALTRAERKLLDAAIVVVNSAALKESSNG